MNPVAAALPPPFGTLMLALTVIDAALRTGGMAYDAFQRLQAQRNFIERLVAEKRDPTPAEWDEINAQINTWRTQLHSVTA